MLISEAPWEIMRMFTSSGCHVVKDIGSDAGLAMYIVADQANNRLLRFRGNLSDLFQDRSVTLAVDVSSPW